MTRFTPKLTTAPANAVTAALEYRASSAAVGTSTPRTADVPGGASDSQSAFFWTDSEQPHASADWPTTGYGLSVDVSSIGADVSFDVGLSRVSSDGATLRTVTASGTVTWVLQSRTGTGIHTTTGFAITNVNDDATRSATDRVVERVQSSNSNMMTLQGISIRLEDADTWVENTNFANGDTHQITASGSGTSGGSAAIQIVLIHLLTATGSGASGGTAALTVTHGLTATGSGASGGSAALISTLALSATGSGTSGGSAALHAILQIAASGSGASGGSAAITIVGGGATHPITASGSGVSGGSAALLVVHSISAAGSGQSGGSAALSATLTLTASGSGTSGGSAAIGIVAVHQISASGVSSSGGSAAPTLFHVFRHTFSPPTHEEPIRSTVAPLKFYRLTHAPTVFRRNGQFTSMRTPPAEWLVGVEGEDYFIGGHEYEVSEETKAELVAAGYSVTSV